MPSIHNLIPDIYKLVQTKGWYTDEIDTLLQKEVSMRIKPVWEEKKHRGLRLSQMKPQCPRSLWYSVHHPELAEALPPWAEIKYLYGHLIEAMAITLAKAAGHEVVGEQDAIYVAGIEGHRDCIIDGCLCDVKSTASRSFQKFKDGTLWQDDSFGYLDQLDAYLVGSANDPLLKYRDVAYNWAIDKQLGHMCLYEHKHRPGIIEARVEEYKRIADLPSPPPCRCGTEPDGSSGNIKLDLKASYNGFKHCCFPNLRTFLYENGPRYLVHVEKRPMRQDRKTPIPEVDRHGNFIN